jgi:hypothetical protein
MDRCTPNIDVGRIVRITAVVHCVCLSWGRVCLSWVGPLRLTQEMKFWALFGTAAMNWSNSSRQYR